MALVGFELISDEDHALLKAAKAEYKQAGLHYKSTMDL
jgi:hypothetical protein